MATPAFIDRVTKQASILVTRSPLGRAINWLDSSAMMQVQLTADAIALPDANHLVASNANIVVHSTNVAAKGIDYVSASASKLITVGGLDTFVDFPLDGNVVINVSQTPVVFVDTTPQVVYWS